MYLRYIGVRRQDPRRDSPVQYVVIAKSWAEAQRKMAADHNERHAVPRDREFAPHDFDLFNVELPGAKR